LGIEDTARELAKFDAKLTWRCRGLFGYPRTHAERLGFPPDYLRLLDQQHANLEKLRGNPRSD
jgi:hypothetical protein